MNRHRGKHSQENLMILQDELTHWGDTYCIHDLKRLIGYPKTS